MTKLGIIGAMDVEVETLLSEMEQVTSTNKAGSTFHEGVLMGLPVVLVQCGVGKVNAALCVQILCDCFGVTHLVNTGIAGSLCAELDIGDLVVSRDAMYHDFDCVHFGYPFGKVPGMDVIAFPADDTMLGYAFAAAEAVNPGHTRVGRVASGDQFVADPAVKEKSWQTPRDCVRKWRARPSPRRLTATAFPSSSSAPSPTKRTTARKWTILHSKKSPPTAAPRSPAGWQSTCTKRK